METSIQISKINDFLFCPLSIYFHGIYENFDEKTYHHLPQVRGRIKHEPIEKQKYSTAKKYLQGLEVYSEKYNFVGKIDIFDQDKKVLIERKSRVKNIYDGYKYQLYAQYFCFIEMGYEVKEMYLYSMADNKKYNIPLPVGEELSNFEKVIEDMKNFEISKKGFKRNHAKCAQCIYKELCY